MRAGARNAAQEEHQQAGVPVERARRSAGWQAAEAGRRHRVRNEAQGSEEDVSRRPFSIAVANRERAERRRARAEPLARSNWLPPRENRAALVSLALASGNEQSCRAHDTPLDAVARARQDAWREEQRTNRHGLADIAACVLTALDRDTSRHSSRDARSAAQRADPSAHSAAQFTAQR